MCFNKAMERPHEWFNGFIASSAAPTAFETSRKGFLGTYGSIVAPEAIKADKLAMEAFFEFSHQAKGNKSYGENMRFTNIGADETLRIKVEDGFEVHDGHPTFKKTYTDPINAKQFAEEMVKHNYRAGWNLTAMPK